MKLGTLDLIIVYAMPHGLVFDCSLYFEIPQIRRIEGCDDHKLVHGG